MLLQVVKVQREKLAPCITCPLCNKLFRDATTISECLHSFCRKCIYKKINDEEQNSCPVCNTNLGCSPLEKLRADHSLEDLKAKIFPSKREKKVKSVVPVKTLPPVKSSIPVKRKEISLSSLVANPIVSPPKVFTPAQEPEPEPEPAVAEYVPRPSKRLKAIARKSPALREAISIDEIPVKKTDDFHERLSSPETTATLTKIAEIKRLNSFPDTSKQHKTNKDSEDSSEPCEGKKVDLLKPLTGLVDVVSRSEVKQSNNIQETPVVQTMQLPDPVNKEAQVVKSNVEEQIVKPEVKRDENNSVMCSPAAVKTRKLRQKRAAVSEGLNFTAQEVVDSSSEYDGRFDPIWFALIASDDQEGVAPLPQISSCYLRIKDGSLPVATIKKYLAKKLGLTNWAEVEIWLLGQPVISTLQLYDLVDLWLQMAPPSERIQTRVGSSAKDFVMVLSYSRKFQSS